MNKTQDETTQDASPLSSKRTHRHPYTLSNSREETLKRMKTFPERAAKFLEKLNADRKKNPR